MIFFDEYSNCMLCPRKCGVNRNKGEIGYCGSDSQLNISSICIHKGEEPAISGKKGICNVFFARCNMQCVFCQNHQISRRRGQVQSSIYSITEAVREITDILDRGIASVGFVTPTHFTPHVRHIIRELNTKGYHPVFVYNSNGYDNVEIIKAMEELIDVYLPDFKYYNNKFAALYSDTLDYREAATVVLKEMYRQKGSTVVLNDNRLAVKGLIIRHLVLPGTENDSMDILNWIADNLSPEVYISLMSQYYPTSHVADHMLLGRQVTLSEYQTVVKKMTDLGFNSGWIQRLESADYYLPDFNTAHPFDG